MSTPEATLEHLRGLSKALDGAVTIPGTRVRVGLDPLIGLVPVVGDWIGAGLSAYFVVRAAGLGVSAATGMRMLANLAVDTMVGTVPVLGDIFDLGFRANQRNLALLEDHLRDPARRRAADRVALAVIAVGAVGIVVGALALMAWLVTRLAAGLSG